MLLSGVAAAQGISQLSKTPDWAVESNQAGAQFGLRLGTAGDVNGDGYDDVIVGAPTYVDDQTSGGRVYVYHGSATGLNVIPNWTAESDQAEARFGDPVLTAGDVNGDGYDDIIVGAPRYDNGQTNEGRAFVYFGSATGLSDLPNWTAESNQVWALFGNPVAAAGDVNGDGYDDVMVGARYYDNGQSDEGRVYIYHGSAIGPSTSPDWTAESNQSGALFGQSVGTAGDVNGDGYDDIIVGAYWYDNGQTNEGLVYVYYGGATGLGTTVAWTAEGNQSDAWFGDLVRTAGDVNGDGYDDVIVGALYYDNGQSNEGRAYVYQGSAMGLSTSPAWTFESDQTDAYLGHAAGTTGDINGDGYDDIIVGAHFFDDSERDEGRIYVFHGNSSGLGTDPVWTAEIDQAGALFGNAVGMAGDVNGDGYADTIVGAYGYDNGETTEGAAFGFYGSGPPVPNQPPEAYAGGPYTGDEGQPVALDASASTDPDDNIVLYEWDLDNDGEYDDATGSTTDVIFDDNGSYLVDLRVTDEYGESDTDPAAITVNNIAPTADFANASGTLIEGESAMLVFSNQLDPSAPDTIAGFFYSYGCTDNGPYELTDSPITWFVCDFPDNGTFTTRGRIEDKDGGFTDYTAVIIVLTPSEAIEDLADIIEDLNLQQQIENSLDAKLDSALRALDDLNENNDAAAINSLQAFINAVEAQRGNKITDEQADTLISAAQAIIDSLSTP
jgi:hypothetical protein